MNNTPKWLRDYWDKNPATKCERWKEGTCKGRLTKEHAWIYGGKQIQEIWACLDLCWEHHLGEGLNKKLNQLIALNRATPQDLAKYPNRDWVKERRRLEYDLKQELKEYGK